MSVLQYKTTEQYLLYIRNLKFAHLTHIFRLHYIHLEFVTCPHKFKWMLCTDKPVFNACFKDIYCTNINSHLICFVIMCLKAKNYPYTTRNFILDYVFIVCFETNQMLNHTFRNENYKEVVTEHLKYLMLPVLLGDMNSRLTSLYNIMCTIYD